ncbi:hypothetical protein BVC80_8349g15 [Macleaya cordata]|uniref:Uncharacterized protein n=1 Tax=Macleaya cordata TaxID=56857 RepID=A0A200QAW7_MACCD|nr:hypothetical protein BVC80_8349g15 [Macleaya cordata]
MMGRREGTGGGAPNSAELSLVCFPSRSNLSLMPHKPICSPGHPTETTKRHRHNHRNNRGGRASPLFWAKTKPEMNEPTSPKVNCAGNIKVSRPKSNTTTSTTSTNSSKNWHSVMQEIELIHNSKKVVKKQRRPNSSAWVIKKDIMQFLTGGLKSIRFNLRKRFGSITAAVGSDITSSSSVNDHEEVVEDDEDQENEKQSRSGANSSKTNINFQGVIVGGHDHHHLN